MAVRKNTKGDGKEYHYWDYTFEWTDKHMAANELNSWILKYDSLADNCNEILTKLMHSSHSDAGNIFKRDSYALLQENHKSDPRLSELWTQINTVPDWVDWAQIQRGQDIYWRYLIPISNALTYQSLLGGLGAIRVGETIARTGGFGAQVVRRRLLETFQYTLQVNSNAEGMKPGGKGHLACVRVRLLHSAVRLKIMSLAAQDPTYYDMHKYGPPINDLDSFGTIHTFSSAVIWQGLPRQGIYLSNQDAEDYIALWRLVAYYMGVPTEPFKTAAAAKVAHEWLLVNEFAPSDTGRMLARNIVIGLENTGPAYASKEYMDAMARLLNGDRLSDELHIPRTSLYYRLLMWGYCYWVQLQARTIQKIPFIDRFLIARRRKVTWDYLMGESGGLGKETLFDFKYMPSLGRTTCPGQRKSYTFKRPVIVVSNNSDAT
ncbi:hypothetical protein J3458_001638 [Metarhizium acridum]|uniref:uncharacterized protein n=1 Tax=Metarhizium acridum TaxID=92637 RepID=UPI001C6D1403|nr:hypothetical protein J3458_001638 [Metarhizium acridum]